MLPAFNLGGGMEVVAAKMCQRRPNLARQRSSNAHIFSIHSRILVAIMLTFLY